MKLRPYKPTAPIIRQNLPCHSTVILNIGKDPRLLFGVQRGAYFRISDFPPGSITMGALARSQQLKTEVSENPILQEAPSATPYRV
jgi:hypothetical protein